MNRRSAEASKQKITESARQVFADQGYAQASMRTIAREAGISVGGLYLYFRNKEELYLTLMQEWMDNLNGTTREALRKIDDPRESLRAFITITIDFTRGHREMIILQGRELGFTFGIDLKKQFFRERRQIITGIIRRGIDAGIFRQCDADEAARIIFNVLRGFVISMVIDEEALFSAGGCVDLVLNGLLRRNEG
ncbi:MAG: TetR/AcrR family transcriptional regulator [Geobacteraceae bacterium]|nr:TetR/AcrR family transcriptional regulator [Geobacteraceae bacterium]